MEAEGLSPDEIENMVEQNEKGNLRGMLARVKFNSDPDGRV